jgi:acyl-CoA oxidase
LQDLHIMLCAHKAYFTEWATFGIIQLIRACGGHGFSHFSGLPSLLFTQFPDMILEGENSVLFLQISRGLLNGMR